MVISRHAAKALFILLALVLAGGCGSSGSVSAASTGSDSTPTGTSPTPNTGTDAGFPECVGPTRDTAACDGTPFGDCMQNPQGGDETKCSDFAYALCLSSRNDDQECSDSTYIECMQSDVVYDENLCDDAYHGSKILLSTIDNPGGGDIECSQLDKPVVINEPDRYNLDEDGDGVGCEWNDPSAVPAGA